MPSDDQRERENLLEALDVHRNFLRRTDQLRSPAPSGPLFGDHVFAQPTEKFPQVYDRCRRLEHRGG